MPHEYGTLTSLVKVIGAMMSSGVAIGLAWRGRTNWEPAEEDVSRGPQKVAALLTTVSISLLWALRADTTFIPSLTRFAVSNAIVCLIALIVYGILIGTFTYSASLVTASGQRAKVKIIGGLWLLRGLRAQLSTSTPSKTIQEYLDGTGGDPDHVWAKFSRALAKATFVLAYIALTFCGTLALAAAGIIVLLTQTSLPVPKDKTVVHVAILLNGSVHYTTEILSGFQVALDSDLLKTRYSAHYETAIGYAEVSSREKNGDVLKELFGRFSKPPDYLITIGTGVTEYARTNVTVPLVFIGVTDPIKSGIVASLSASKDRGNIAGTTYGVNATEYWRILTNAFPGKTFGFVLNDDYNQDSILLDEFKQLAQVTKTKNQLIEIRKRKPPLSKEDEDMADVFFGRYFVSTQIEKFTTESRKPFVGASVVNVYKGAVMAIGSNDQKLGKTAADEIVLPSLVHGVALHDIPILTVSDPVIAVNLKAARDCGISLPKSIVDSATIRAEE